MDTREDEVVIPRSRMKAVVIVAVCLAGCVFAIHQLSIDADEIRKEPVLNSPVQVYGLAVTFLLVSVPCIIFFGRRLLDSSPGLILNCDGILDRSGMFSTGFIPWSDVTQVEVYRLKSNRWVVVRVRNPATYTSRGNAIQRRLHRAHLKRCGSPILISSLALSISFNDLYQLLREGLREYRQDDYDVAQPEITARGD